MQKPRLWSWMLSPFSGKVRVAAAEMDVELELLEIDPRNRPARLKELNPSNRVPVLEVGEVAIRESTPICEFLMESYSEKSLWPPDPAEKAAARGMLRWVDDELLVNFFLSLRKEAFGLDPTDHPDLVATLQGALTQRLATTDRLLRGTDGPWLMGGEEPTLTDLAAMPLAVRLPAWRPALMPDPEAHPHVTAWLAALSERPSAAEIDRRGEPVT